MPNRDTSHKFDSSNGTPCRIILLLEHFDPGFPLVCRCEQELSGGSRAQINTIFAPSTNIGCSPRESFKHHNKTEDHRGSRCRWSTNSESCNVRPHKRRRQHSLLDSLTGTSSSTAESKRLARFADKLGLTSSRLGFSLHSPVAQKMPQQAPN